MTRGFADYFGFQAELALSVHNPLFSIQSIINWNGRRH